MPELEPGGYFTLHLPPPDGERVGVILPTYNRPDLARLATLQLLAQTRVPDVICVHQNGHPESYAWAVQDLRPAERIAWLHTPHRLERQHDWYALPLERLLIAGCTRFFWADHDDLYLTNHVEAGLAELREFDCSVSMRCGVLHTRPTDFRYEPNVEFTSHGPGGMSSTMCFNRAFAQALLHDLRTDTSQQYADNVVSKLTMPRFKCVLSTRRSAVYHAHEGSATGAAWLDKAFA